MFGRQRDHNISVNNRLDAIMQRIDAFEARLKALEQGQKRHSERDRTGRFTSAKGAVKDVTGSE